MAKIMRKPLPPVMSWWSERRNLLAGLKPKHVKAKKVIKMKKAIKAKKGKAKRTN